MKLIPNIDWSLWRQTGGRVLLDLWIPAVLALVITAFRSKHSWTDWFTDVSFFFTTLFFAAAYFSYIQRARKFVMDDRNHSNVVAKQDALINRLEMLATDLSDRQAVLVERLENLTDNLAGHTTGGDGFCYVWLARTGPSSLIELNIMVKGKYPMQKAHLGVTNFESMAPRFEHANATGDVYLLMAKDFEHTIDMVLPEIVYMARCNLPFKSQDRVRLHLHWKAKNGTWYQRIQLERVDGKWLQATYVKRKEELLLTKVDDGYPLDQNGNPVFHEYETNQDADVDDRSPQQHI